MHERHLEMASLQPGGPTSHGLEQCRRLFMQDPWLVASQSSGTWPQLHSCFLVMRLGIPSTGTLRASARSLWLSAVAYVRQLFINSSSLSSARIIYFPPGWQVCSSYLTAAVLIDLAKCVLDVWADTMTSSSNLEWVPATVFPIGPSHSTRSPTMRIFCEARRPSL